jgi:hypothetical protein
MTPIEKRRAASKNAWRTRKRMAEAQKAGGLVKHGGTLCSNCLSNAPKPGQRYCKECHAAYMREWRIGRRPTLEEKEKSSCRSASRRYKFLGIIVQQPLV